VAHLPVPKFSPSFRPIDSAAPQCQLPCPLGNICERSYSCSLVVPDITASLLTAQPPILCLRLRRASELDVHAVWHIQHTRLWCLDRSGRRLRLRRQPLYARPPVWIVSSWFSRASLAHLASLGRAVCLRQAGVHPPSVLTIHDVPVCATGSDRRQGLLPGGLSASLRPLCRL
jgi:hypothetical protein